MLTQYLIPASAASIIESAANGGGTKTRLASAPVASTASFTVSNTGTPSTISPDLPGVTPATTFVPYSIISFVWNLAILPVMPWTITFVFSSIKILMILLSI